MTHVTEFRRTCINKGLGEAPNIGSTAPFFNTLRVQRLVQYKYIIAMYSSTEVRIQEAIVKPTPSCSSCFRDKQSLTDDVINSSTLQFSVRTLLIVRQVLCDTPYRSISFEIEWRFHTLSVSIKGHQGENVRTDILPIQSGDDDYLRHVYETGTRCPGTLIRH